MALAYLFTCTFTDGTTLTQNQDDVSTVDKTKSAFYDVMQRINDVAIFTLVSDDQEHSVTIDLRDGHFEADKTSFRIHSSEEIPAGAKLHLIYFRRNTHTVTADSQAHDVVFHIGWQANINGKNFQQTIAVE